MKITNDWLGYSARSYKLIKASLLQRLKAKAPEVTDLSESNLLVIILSMVAAVAETIHFYIDAMAREVFLATAQKFSSVMKHAKLIDYRVKASMPASVDITITLLDGNGDPIAATSNYTIPGGSEFETSSGVVFTSTRDVIIAGGEHTGIVPCLQRTHVSNLTIAVSNGLPNQVYSLGKNYVHNSLALTIDGEVWERVDSFSLSTSNSKHYIVEVEADGLAYVKFGDGTYGEIPPNGVDIEADYFITKGTEGNDINPEEITIASLTIPAGASSLEVYNVASPAGGTNYEDIDQVRFRAPLSLRTLERAVTDDDYKNLVTMAPGVAKGAINFDCGKLVDLYVVPAGGGIASSQLILDTQNWVDERKMVTTNVVVHAAGEVKLHITADIVAKPRADGLVMKSNAVAALKELFSTNNQEVNGDIRLSDIYAKIDNLLRVDYVDIKALFVVPYARKNIGTRDLKWEPQVLKGSSEAIDWQIVYTGINYMVFKDGVNIGTAFNNVPFTDNEQTFQFTPHNDIYAVGDTWTFTVYEYQSDVVLRDYTIPIISDDNLTLSAYETNSFGNKTLVS